MDHAMYGFLFQPNDAQGGLNGLLQDDCPYDLGTRREVPALHFCGFVDTVFVEPFPAGDVKGMKEEREYPVCNNG